MSLLSSQLPAGWSWETISSRYRITKKPKGLDYVGYAAVPFVPMQAIPANGHEVPIIEMRRPEDIASGAYFEKGDILLSKITPSFENGKQALASNIPAPFGIASTEIIPLQAAVGTEADTRFLFYYLLHPEVRSTLASKMEGSTGRQRVPEHVVRDFAIPMPPKMEQKKIAAVLWKIQRARRIEEKLLHIARELREAASRHLFSKGLSVHGERDTEIGSVPDSWINKQLSDVADIAYGAQAAVASATDPTIGTPILTNINITNRGKIDLTKLRYYDIPPKHRKRLELRKGDVLFNWRSGSADHVGKTALFDLDGAFTYSSFILRFRVRKDVSSDFLYYYLNHIKKAGFFSNRRNVSSINSVFNASLAATIPVFFPVALKEQSNIVRILRQADQNVEIHERKLEILAELFKATLCQLMNGQIRVANLDIDLAQMQ